MLASTPPVFDRQTEAWRGEAPEVGVTGEDFINGLVLLGKILTGNHRLSHEDHGAFRLKFSQENQSIDVKMFPAIECYKPPL